ncbi:MAG: aminotransferase class I/II-fold pyridoxal phosphate-dependent enzyme [Thermomicrobiales bacterium]
MTLRPDKHDPQSLAFATQAVHIGNEIDAGSGAIRTPLVMANSYALPEDPTGIDWSDTNSLFYTRNTGLNQLRLEEKLAALERGEAAAVFATGVAALHGVFFTLLESGDHVVLSDVTYEAIWRLFDELLPDKYGISATFVDITNPDEVRAAMRPETKLIHTEVIANPTTEVADIAALAEIAHESGALLTVDSTFSPPPMFRPLEHGADLVAHSLTKYINGHGDAMGGAVIGSNALISKIKADALVDVGGAISPFNAWMITRGSVTLPLRLRQHVESAQRVAEFLAKDPFVAYVYYPGLASHPQHESARRQFGDYGFGGMLAFAVEGDADTQNRFVSNLKVITSAVSLGHDESLIVHVGPEGRGGWERYPEPFRRYGHLRFSVGLEDPSDLIADLSAALDATFG